MWHLCGLLLKIWQDNGLSWNSSPILPPLFSLGISHMGVTSNSLAVYCVRHDTAVVQQQRALDRPPLLKQDRIQYLYWKAKKLCSAVRHRVWEHLVSHLFPQSLKQFENNSGHSSDNVNTVSLPGNASWVVSPLCYWAIFGRSETQGKTCCNFTQGLPHHHQQSCLHFPFPHINSFEMLKAAHAYVWKGVGWMLVFTDYGLKVNADKEA